MELSVKLLIIGIIAGFISMLALAFLLHGHAKKKYDYKIFNIPILIMLLLAGILIIIAYFLDDPNSSHTFLSGIADDTLYICIGSLAIIALITAVNIVKTNVIIAIAVIPVYLMVVLVPIIIIIIAIIYVLLDGLANAFE